MHEVETGECLSVLKGLETDSIDTVLTDPPYALSFMGKGWDKVLPPEEVWRECLRVAKPGAMLLAFGGTRTHHRLMCSIEDAGWEIRDCLMWLYGSGFPKGQDISKAIDRSAGAKRDRVPATGGLNNNLNLNDDGWKGVGSDSPTQESDTPATEAAQLWDGWNTALKPAWEPIVLAMKPIDGTFAANALKHGVAGLNVDGCRIGTTGGTRKAGAPSYVPSNALSGGEDGSLNGGIQQAIGKGRWPANVIHDGCADERFFYCAKAQPKDRKEYNTHPTVKPHELMRWLVRLTATPTGGIVLDPFCGSGSTGVACKVEGRDFAGIEMDPDFADIARRRMEEA